MMSKLSLSSLAVPLVFLAICLGRSTSASQSAGEIGLGPAFGRPFQEAYAIEGEDSFGGAVVGRSGTIADKTHGQIGGLYTAKTAFAGAAAVNGLLGVVDSFTVQQQGLYDISVNLDISAYLATYGFSFTGCYVALSTIYLDVELKGANQSPVWGSRGPLPGNDLADGRGCDPSGEIVVDLLGQVLDELYQGSGIGLILSTMRLATEVVDKAEPVPVRAVGEFVLATGVLLEAGAYQITAGLDVMTAGTTFALSGGSCAATAISQATTQVCGATLPASPASAINGIRLRPSGPPPTRPRDCIPTLLSPTKDAALPNSPTGVSWQFSWSPCDGATEYQIEIDGPAVKAIGYPADGQDPWLASVVGETSILVRGRQSIPDAALTGWTWRVRARFGVVFGDWSEPRVFGVAQQDTAPPTIGSATCSPVYAQLNQPIRCHADTTGSVRRTAWTAWGGSPATGTGTDFVTSFATLGTRGIGFAACNDAGCAEALPQVWVTSPEQPCPMAAPTITYPTSGAVLSDGSIDVSWTGIGYQPGGMLAYDMLVSTVQGTGSEFSFLPSHTLRFQPGPVTVRVQVIEVLEWMNGDIHRWNGCSALSEPVTFTVQ